MTIAGVLAAFLFVAPAVPAASASSATSTSSQVLAVDAGDAICAIRTDTTIGCWGSNEFLEATPPPGTFKAVSAGHKHSCGIRTDGTLACWGSEAGGPGPLPSGTFTALSAGDDGCAIRSDGTLACWAGALGNDPSSPPAGTFTVVTAGESGDHCAIRTDQTLACWVLTAGDVSAPPGTFTAVSAGWDHVCAIRTDGTVTCWGGENEFGQATPPAGTFTALSSGTYYTCAIRTDETLKCWGANDFGQATPPAGTFTSVTASWGACGIRTDGTLACWGGAMPVPGPSISTAPWPATTAIKVDWSARQAVAPVTSYDVRYRRAPWNGTFGSRARWRSATTETSATFPAAPGYTYCFSARAHDADGGVSWWADEACSAVPLDDRSLARLGNWTALTDARLYRSTGLRSYTYGARLRRTGVFAMSIKLLATTCPRCGTVRVYWNSTLLKTLNLYSATRADRRLFRVKVFEGVRTGTLTIKVVSSGRKVIIDGVAIGREVSF